MKVSQNLMTYNGHYAALMLFLKQAAKPVTQISISLYPSRECMNIQDDRIANYLHTHIHRYLSNLCKRLRGEVIQASESPAKINMAYKYVKVQHRARAFYAQYNLPL